MRKILKKVTAIIYLNPSFLNKQNLDSRREFMTRGEIDAYQTTPSPSKSKKRQRNQLNQTSREFGNQRSNSSAMGIVQDIERDIRNGPQNRERRRKSKI